MKINEYLQYDALGLGELVKSHQVTADELLDTALSIAKEMQPKIGALCHLNLEDARQRIKTGLPEGPFTGVPFLLKDIKAQAEAIPMSCGSRFFADQPGRFDNELIKRYRRAGLVIFGRTTTSELALYIGTESRAVYGYDTANPWDPALSPGGSSGGASAAVAAGILPMAHATDGAGSIRLPAANCGLVGLKPSRALLPAGPVIGEMWGGMLTDGVISRSVRDTAASLDATMGPDSGCPYYAAPVREGMLDAISCPPRRLRIAFMKDLFGRPVSNEVAEVIEKTAVLCTELGHEVEETQLTELDGPAMWDAFMRVMVIATAMTIEDRAAVLGRMPLRGELEEPTFRLLDMAKQLRPTDYPRAVATLHRITRQIAPFFERYDVLLTPLGEKPSEALGYFRDHPPAFSMEALAAGDHSSYSLYEPLANLTGQPAISLPVFLSSSGLPVGSQFFGRVGEDALLLQLAAQLEKARPWFDKLAPLTRELASRF